MKNKILALVVFFFAINVNAKKIEIDDGAVVFNAPDSFTELTKEEIALKYPSNRAPRFVVGNESRATTIAYDIKSHAILEDQLDAVMKSFEQTFNRIVPGIEWKKKEMI